MKIEAWEAALTALKMVLKVEPNNEKALFRKAKVLEEKGNYDEALGILRRVTRLFPDNKPAKNDMIRLTAKQKKNKDKEFRMSRKMLGLDKPSNSSSSSWFPKIQKPSTIGFCLLVGAVGSALGAITAFYKLREI